MIKFEKVERFADSDINLPVRKTRYSAGYDFEVAEDITIPTLQKHMNALIYEDIMHIADTSPLSLEEMAERTKKLKAKPTLVPTGIKAKMDDDMYLQLSIRSSTPLKNWLIMGNSVGIIDSDYYSNQDNDGEIFFQIINLGPRDIKLKKGDVIGQGIFHKYITTDDDDQQEKQTRQGGFGSTSE